MTDTTYDFNIPIGDQSLLNVPLKEGNVVFVLGANGVGKSALMHRVYSAYTNKSKKILAHRQIWFAQGMSSITAFDKTQRESWIKSNDQGIESRYTDNQASERSKITIFDLVDSENIRARKITSFLDKDDITGATEQSKLQSPIQDINEILRLSNTLIQIRLAENGELLVSKNNCNLYSISELSDGERNALLICADVLTAEPNQLIIIDEPERHLHRSIISPLLSTLFNKRKDCAFIVATHDIQLPIDHSDSSVVLIRNCTWINNNIEYWEADLISDVENVPDDVKQSILGSKRSILFVEGLPNSLDKQFYQLIYPELSVISKGSCTDVIEAVNGGNGIHDLVWVKFYGLIDADDRTEDQIQRLLGANIATTQAYSVESLYYHIDIIREVAEKYSEITGQNANDLYENATSNIVNEFERHKTRMCARLCEKRIKNWVMSQLPNHRNICNKEVFKIEKNLGESLLEEEAIADALINIKDLKGIISRYPIRETSIIDGIIKGLVTDRNTYESTVRKLISDNTEIRDFYKNLLEQLTGLVELTSPVS